jgi:hypothetical protein
MENVADLIERLLEIQSGGRQRSPELIVEDERLMDRLQNRNLAGKPTQATMLSQDSLGQMSADRLCQHLTSFLNLLVGLSAKLSSGGTI